jgi:hypothetical protein
MATTKKGGMHGGKNHKLKGLTSITDKVPGPVTTSSVPQVMRREATRPGPGKHGGKQRGDRRDMNPTFTGNEKHSARGNTPRKGNSTRAR